MPTGSRRNLRFVSFTINCLLSFGSVDCLDEVCGFQEETESIAMKPKLKSAQRVVRKHKATTNRKEFRKVLFATLAEISSSLIEIMKKRRIMRSKERELLPTDEWAVNANKANNNNNNNSSPPPFTL